MLLNNRYHVTRTLGSGGFGETFLAEDTQMPSNRRCVVKQLKPIHQNPQIYQLVQERFAREAAVLEELGGSHDQIPALYAYFQLNGQFYLVQEWIEGETLTARLRRQGILSESAVQEILVSLLPVLEYIHSKHIVHRDIKPDNIIIRRSDAKPVLIDFGAVRETMGTVLNSQGSLTSSIVIGTPGYMPSEQAAGRPVYSSDLYSLGVTAIYLLTGKNPQELETDSQTGEIVWYLHTSDNSSSLAKVIDRAIAFHPRDRFSSAKDMLKAIQSVVHAVSPTQELPHAESKTIKPPPLSQSTTVLSKHAQNFTTPATTQGNNRNPILIGSTISASLLRFAIAGGLIGASVIVGILLRKSSRPLAQQTASPIANLPTTTSQQIATAQSTPSLSRLLVKNYSWLSKRPVTDSDLEEKDGFELDIMRNSIFAQHGRRFDTPGLQVYFKNQPWYRPLYSPDEFDNLNLLSSLEQRNVEYINAYQDRYNRRYFRKN
jgi:serine/threonine-protein kinase